MSADSARWVCEICGGKEFCVAQHTHTHTPGRHGCGCELLIEKYTTVARSRWRKIAVERFGAQNVVAQDVRKSHYVCSVYCACRVRVRSC